MMILLKLIEEANSAHRYYFFFYNSSTLSNNNHTSFFQNNFSIVDRIRNDLRSKSKSPDVSPSLEPVSILSEELKSRSEVCVISQFLTVPSKSAELQTVQDLTPEKSDYSTRNRTMVTLNTQSKSVKSSENSKYTNSTQRTLSLELEASLKSNIKSDTDTVLRSSGSTKPDLDVKIQSSSSYHQSKDYKTKLTKGKVLLNLNYS